MEPPAMTSCSERSSRCTKSIEKICRRAAERSRNQPVSVQSHEFDLQNKLSLTYAAPSNRGFVELPDNFMEVISPEQSQEQIQQPVGIAEMGVNSIDNGYAVMVPMTSSQNYMVAVKKESPEDQVHYQSTLNHGAPAFCYTDKSTSFAANLISNSNPNRYEMAAPRQSVVGAQQHYGTACPTESRALLRYIKEEGNLISEEEQQANMNQRLVNTETPPAVSTVERATSYIATMCGGKSLSSFSQQPDFRPNDSSFAFENGHEVDRGCDVDGISVACTSANQDGLIYSKKDGNDLLNAEIDENIYIDTRDLCKRIAWELKRYSIPQAVFAEKILCRSQGTLSDLLRNPKPWNKLKSGRETFRRMFNWVQMPMQYRLGILGLAKESDANSTWASSQRGLLAGEQFSPSNMIPLMSPPAPAQNAKQGSRRRSHDDENGGINFGTRTKKRLIFTDIQKRTLQAIFKETQRPSREMQQTIADHLQLDLSTVANFFMNARRRSRSDPVLCDSPAPFQQVRPVSPPPESSPYQQRERTRNRSSGRTLLVYDNENCIAGSSTGNIVGDVSEEALKFVRKRNPC